MSDKQAVITVSSEHHAKLKELAAKDKRTLRAYLEIVIDSLPQTNANVAQPKTPAPAQTMEDIMGDWNTDTL